MNQTLLLIFALIFVCSVLYAMISDYSRLRIPNTVSIVLVAAFAVFVAIGGVANVWPHLLLAGAVLVTLFVFFAHGLDWRGGREAAQRADALGGPRQRRAVRGAVRDPGRDLRGGATGVALGAALLSDARRTSGDEQIQPLGAQRPVPIRPPHRHGRASASRLRSSPSIEGNGRRSLTWTPSSRAPPRFSWPCARLSPPSGREARYCCGCRDCPAPATRRRSATAGRCDNRLSASGDRQGC